MARRVRSLVVLLLSVFALAQCGPNGASGVDPVGARAFESRLYAPCCYNGTLDVHESDLARQLRKEIEERLSHGETTDAVQADFVARYGERVLAARSDRPFRWATIVGLCVALLGAAALGIVMRRWLRAAPVVAKANEASPKERDEWDERIDDDLDDLDG